MRPVLESTIIANDLSIATYEWPAPAGAPVVFFAHATGFHAHLWDQVIERLPGVHCWAIDMRGHGRSAKPAPPYPWRNFALDVAAVSKRLGLDHALAVGHSKGGYAITMAAADEPGIFGNLLLIDPVILPRSRYGTGFGGEHFAARRRNAWATKEEMFERFAGRPPFDAWDPAVLHDYVDYGLLPAPDGDGFVLACPPAVEAATYAGSGEGVGIYDSIAALTLPVRILRARQREERPGAPMDMSSSPTTPDLASFFADAEDVYLPQYSHFIPMEAPGFIADQVLEMLA
jgi:pimeloyl-ACP methyl ester carboxylesterase